MPYPEPRDANATKFGKGNRGSDTEAEMRVRSALHRRGLRFRVNHPIRCGEIRVRPDVVFTRLKIAVFVDGCFWHSCPEHGRTPKTNSDYWTSKLDSNLARDRRVDAALSAHGWLAVRVWEHEPPAGVATRIEALVRAKDC